MRRILIVIALAVAAPALFLAQSEGKAAQDGDDERALTGIEQELTDAVLKNDPAPVERHYADTFTFTTPGGEVVNKAQVVANLKSGDLKFESSKVEDMKVRVYGDAAVVTSATTDKGRYKGADVSGRYRWTDVFVRRGGRWQLVAAHGTRVAQQRP